MRRDTGCESFASIVSTFPHLIVLGLRSVLFRFWFLARVGFWAWVAAKPGKAYCRHLCL